MTITPDAAADRSATTMVVLFHDRGGALERVLGAARRQGCVLTTLALERAAHPGLARLRLTVDGGHPTQLARQLARLVDVVDVRDATPGPTPHDPQPDVPPTPFHSQADGVTPTDSDTETPTPLTED
jgi:acetolactate synthase regulatory subunit